MLFLTGIENGISNVVALINVQTKISNKVFLQWIDHQLLKKMLFELIINNFRVYETEIESFFLGI